MTPEIITRAVRTDPAGSGEFGAPRGSRAHRGIDYVFSPGEDVLSPATGKITKLGYAYGDDLSWRIVDVTDTGGFRHRLFYVDPLLKVGDYVAQNDVVGLAQDITRRYPDSKMIAHVHYQIHDEDGEIVNPNLFYQAREARS